MDYRIRRQTVIVLIIILFLGAAGSGVYFGFFRQAPTCADNIQNQKEEGVDCGGPCMSCERRTIKDVEILWTKYLLLENNRYDLVARISNPNPNFGLAQFDYIFKIYDSLGEPIKEQTSKSFILPGQVKYLIEGNVEVGQKVSRIELVIDSTAKDRWSKINDEYRAPSLYARDKQFRFLDNPAGAAEISGVLVNDSAYDFDMVNISAIVMDKSKQVIAANKTQAYTIKAGEGRYFSMLWFSPINKDNVVSQEFQVETNLLSDDNFMRKYGVQEKFQEY